MVSTVFDDSNLMQRNYALGSLIRGIENVIIFLLILQFSTALIALFLTDFNNLEYESPLARALWYPGYVLVALMALRCLPQIVRLAVFNPFVVLCVFICGLSWLWSIDPGVTLRRSIALMVTTIFGLVLAARYDWSGLVQRLALGFGFLAIASLFIALIMPRYGVMDQVHVGAWRGAWVDKNYMGGFMAKGVIVMMCAFAMRPDRGWIWIPLGFLCFGLVLMSTSKTALLVTMLGISGFIVIRMFRRFPFIRIPLMYTVIAGVAAFTALMLLAPDLMFDLIGKERTLTGRTDIWNGLIDNIKAKPWLGHGYGVYWLDPLGPSYYVRLNLQWGVPSAHNGWLDTWLSIGALGVAVFAFYFLFTIILALDRIKKGGTETYWVILSTMMFLMFSMSESTILQQNDLSWVIFVATTSKLFAFERPFWRKRARLPYFLTRQVPV